jgi:S1-C subfamily serine protease
MTIRSALLDSPGPSMARRSSALPRLFLLAAVAAAGYWTLQRFAVPRATAPMTESPDPRGAGAVVPAQLPTRPIRSSLGEDERATIELFRRASPAVVHVENLAVRRDFFRMNVMEIPQGAGSGFMWDERGHVITNFHVVRGADAIQVRLSDQSTWPARAVGGAADKDLAVLRIEAPASRLHPLPRGRSDDLLVGQKVLAIGNPFGLDQSLTTGVISALGREIDSLVGVPIRDVIQTDAAINPGNSGGPLLDSSGRLVGVNTMILSPSGGFAGVGFAIPVDTVEWVVADLIEHGRLVRPTLGVELASPDIAARLRIEGALILDVVGGSGAAEAGLRPTQTDRSGRVRLGDVIVAIEDQPVRSNGDLILALEKRRAGERVRVSIERDGDRREVRVRLSEPR